LPIPPAGFNDHPFTLFYLNGWIMRALGATAWSAKLLPCLFSVGCVMLTLLLGAALFSPTTGLLAGFVLALSPEFIGYGARFHLDTPMTFFILLSFWGWKKRSIALTGIAAGLGIWMKNPVALLVFPAAGLSLLLSARLNRRELTRLSLAFFLALGVGSLIWIVIGSVGGWNLVSDYWHRQVFGTAVGGRNFGRSEPFLFLQVLRRHYWPWLILLIVALYQTFKKKLWKKENDALVLSGALVVSVFISMMKFKFPHYFVPAYPFLALVAVAPFQSWLDARSESAQRWLIAFQLLASAVLLASPISLSPEMFPALKHFDAFIQSYGNCNDRVLYVEGQQPYGSHDDYGAEVGFYANRELVPVDCAGAPGAVEKLNPAWILVSGTNLAQCLPGAQAKFQTRLRFGNQYLLSRVMPKEDAFDLTALEREHRAPVDCGAVPLPQDRYHRH
jgi:4-amino-4-deoxy-L-arabinose transferase-like glycosyltransferase